MNVISHGEDLYVLVNSYKIRHSKLQTENHHREIHQDSLHFINNNPHCRHPLMILHNILDLVVITAILLSDISLVCLVQASSNLPPGSIYDAALPQRRHVKKSSSIHKPSFLLTRGGSTAAKKFKGKEEFQLSPLRDDGRDNSTLRGDVPPDSIKDDEAVAKATAPLTDSDETLDYGSVFVTKRDRRLEHLDKDKVSI